MFGSFGANPAPAFGQSAAPAFGSFGAQPNTQQQQQTNTFGAFGQPQQQQQQAPTAFGSFGQTQSQPSTSLFGAPSQPTNTFGGFGQSTQAQTPAAPAFGQTANTGFGGFGATQPAQSGFGGFGSTTSTAAPSTGFGGFGASTAQPSGFGAAAQSNPFGGSTQQQPAAGTGFGGFGAPAQPAQQQILVGTKSVPYRVTVDRTNDTKGVPQISNYMAITCMPEYQNKSFEELRWEDESGQPAAPGVAPAAPAQQPATTGFGSFGQSQPQQSTSLFGSNTGASTGFGGFGSTTTAAAPSTGFGGFGQPAASNTGSSFGGFGGFGSTAQSQPATQSSLFGSNTTQSTFGQPAATQSSFAFGAPQSSSAASGFGSFGATQSSFGGFGANTGSAFGAAQSQPATTSSFGGFGGFGQSQPAATGGFSLGSTQSTAAPSMFGNTTQPATSFGGFGQQQSSSSLFGGGTSTSLFGSNTATSTGAGFGGFGASAAQPQSASSFNLGGFGSNTGSSLFGSNTASSTGSSFGFGSTAQKPLGFGQQSSSSLFGSNTTGSLFGQPQPGSTQSVGLFGQPAQPALTTGFGAFGQQPQQQPQQQLQQQQQQSLVATIDTDPFMSSFLNATQAAQPKRAVALSQTQLLPNSLTSSLTALQPMTALQPSVTSVQSLLPRTVIPAAQSSVMQMRFGAQPVTVQHKPNIAELLTQQSNNASNQSLIDLLAPRRRLTHVPPPAEIRDDQVLNDSKQSDNKPATGAQNTPATRNNQPQPPQHSQQQQQQTQQSNDEKVYPDLHTTPKPQDKHDSAFAPKQTPNNNSNSSEQRQTSSSKSFDVTAESKYNSPVKSQQRGNRAPTLTRPQYYTIPAIDELQRMPVQQLQHIDYFVVGHEQYGRIEWENVDVTDVNLDDVVVFDRNAKTKTCSVEVYGDTYRGVIPSPGSKLNTPATISLQCWPIDYSNSLSESEKARKLDRYEQRLRETTEKMGAEFIEYEKQQGIWVFAVNGFT